MSYLHGRHSLKFGGEFRLFYNNNFTKDTGSFNFPSVAAFLADNANSFSITLDDRVNSIKQDSIGLFVQDNFKWRPNLTLELGLRFAHVRQFRLEFLDVPRLPVVPGDQQFRLHLPDRRLLHVREERRHLIEIFLRERIKLVIVTLRTAQG